MRTEASLVLAVVGLLAACTASQPPPAPRLDPAIGELPPALAADYQSFAVNCSKCHGLERALTAPVTDTRHWDIYVAKMMRTAGSAIHPDERPRILRFLYWYTERRTGRVEAGGGEARPTGSSGEAAADERPKQEGAASEGEGRP